MASKHKTRTLWLRWAAANALGELVGLGSTFAVTALVFTRLGGGGGAVSVLLTFFFAVASGALEATVVGAAQWWAMHPWFPQISLRSWWLGTFGGALAAYVLGYLPSTIIDFGAGEADAAAAEPPQAVVLLLAAGLGAVAGAVLSFAQWLVLRRHTQGAGVWIPANMLAWAAGMPVIFWGIDLAQQAGEVWQAIFIMVGVLLAAGFIVGAIHGAFLVKLAGRPQGWAREGI